MKKLIAILALLAAGGAFGLAVLNGYVPGLGGHRAQLTAKSRRFMECLKFKEFKEAASFHHPDDLKARPDIPKLLEDFFLIPPENLDIRDVRVDYVELDSTRVRAKVKVTSNVEILNQKTTKDPEAMLYWRLEGEVWYLDLRTTLERGKPSL